MADLNNANLPELDTYCVGTNQSQQYTYSQRSIHALIPNNKVQSSKKLTELMQVNYQEITDVMNQTVSSMLKKQRLVIQTNTHKKRDNNHACQKCDCTGTSECNKKIAFLEGKLRHFLNTPYKKQIIQIYDVQKMGLQNQNYLVEYSDNTLQKVTVKYLKKNYLKSYVQFLEKNCFVQ